MIADDIGAHTSDENKHVFALYVEHELHTLLSEITLTDKELVRRIGVVLRLQIGDEFILFNTFYHVRVRILEISKKHVISTILFSHKNRIIEPVTHWLVPLLEREAFEYTVSMLTVFGARSITPLVTDKVHRKDIRSNEYDRLKRIMIAAAEQSKQFALPDIESPIQLDDLAQWLNSVTKSVDLIKDTTQKQFVRIFFDHAGKPTQELVNNVTSQLKLHRTTELICLVGPEGDLTKQEKEFLKAHEFAFYALTPIILRSCHAATLGMGIIRSFIN